MADFEAASGSLNHPITATTVVTSNVWHHAAATYDGATWNLYLDGVLDGSLAVGVAANAATNVLTTVGSALTTTGVADGFFAGVVDEVRIWSVARTLSQINSTRTVEVTSPQANLLGVWNLNEGSGTTLADNSGNGIIGAAVASPARVAGFVVPDSTAPAAPTGLIATPSATGIVLTWNANSESDLAGYNIYRGTSPGVGTGGTPINGALLTSPTYTDGSLASSSLTAGQTYYYVVAALDTSSNQSAASNEASAVAPAVNRGLQLDGSSQYVTFGAAPGLDASSFTIELWFYQTAAGAPTSTGTGGLNAVPLLSKGRAEAEGSNLDMNWFLGLDAATNKLAADLEEGALGGTPGLNHPIIGNTVVTMNAWHHAAATYDGTTWKLYLDGVADGTLTVGQPARSDSIQHAALGTAMTSAGAALGFFAGVVDEARVWSTARTQAQINTTKNTELTGAQTNLEGRWGLNEGTGTAAADLSTNGRNGTIVAAPTRVAGFVPPAHVNQAPVCAGVTLSTPANTAGDAAPSCTDAENDTLTYAIVAQPSHGTASVLAGQLHYVPATDYEGTDSFTYKANDGSLDSNTATVSVTVTHVNQAPVCAGVDPQHAGQHRR